MPMGWKRSPGCQCRNQTVDPIWSASKYSQAAANFRREGKVAASGAYSPINFQVRKAGLPLTGRQVQAQFIGIEELAATFVA